MVSSVGFGWETSGKYLEANQVPTRWQTSTSGLCLEMRTRSTEWGACHNGGSAMWQAP